MNLAILSGVKRANSCAAAILLAPFFFPLNRSLALFLEVATKNLLDGAPVLFSAGWDSAVQWG